MFWHLFNTQFRHLLLAATLENSNGSMVQDFGRSTVPRQGEAKAG